MRHNLQKLSIVPKPELISYEEIQNVLNLAHEQNRKKGLHYATQNQSVDRLKEKIGTGICYVALLDNCVVGTATVSFRKLDYWYHHGNVAIIKLLGVLPEYSGFGIASGLVEQCVNAAQEKGLTVIVTDSAESNESFKHLMVRKSFLLSDYGIYAANDFYTAVYVRWLDGCPHSSVYRYFRYGLKRLYIRLIYKPGKIRRFTLVSKEK